MSEAAPPETRAPADAAERGSILLPKALIYGAVATALLALPATVFSTAWYMSGQAGDARRQQADIDRVTHDLSEFKLDLRERLSEIGRDLRSIEETNNRTEVRLGKIDSSLSYLANTRSTSDVLGPGRR
jgi:chromosome segregation ATPase